MKQRHTWKLLLPAIALLLLASCGQQQEESNDIPVTTESEEARAAFEEGREAMELGRRNDARVQFDAAIEADPQFAIAYFYRAQVSNSAEEWKRFTDLAIEHKEKASAGEQLLIDMIPMYMRDDREMVLAQAKKLVEAYPKSPRAQLELAQAHDGLNQSSEARAAAETAVTLDETFAPAYRYLANSWVFDEPVDYAKAEGYARKYVELRPEEADAHIVLGDVFRAQTALEKAREAYSKAVQVDPEHSVAYSKRGHAHTFLGEYDEARADFSSAIEHALGPFKVGAANFGVYTYLYAGDPAAALSANEAVMNSIPDMIPDPAEQRQAKSNCFEDRAHIAAVLGDFDAAREAFEAHASLRRSAMAMMESPELSAGTEADLALLEGWITARAGDPETAGALADAAGEHLATIKNPRKLEGVHALKGYVALLTGDAAAALKHFAQADSEWIVVKFYSAKAEEALGNTDRAMELYRDVAEWNFNGLQYALVRPEAVQKIAG